jgi:secondary thiamine-phosphate synthase enzyme
MLEPMVKMHTHEITTRGQGDARDVTSLVARVVAESGADSGIATTFVVGSTAGMTTLEFEPGVVQDLDGALAVIAPGDGNYRHHLRWGDDNGSSHVRAALVGPSVVVPFSDGKLLLGTWQQVVLVEFDTQARHRRLVIQVLGE